MVCVRCGKDIESEAAFCRHCGASQNAPGTPRRLIRLSSQGRIAGVCAGIADYLNADVTLVRLVWVLLSIIPGALLGGVLAYLAAWILLPESHADVNRSGTARLTRSATDRKIAGVCGGIARIHRHRPDRRARGVGRVGDCAWLHRVRRARLSGRLVHHARASGFDDGAIAAHGLMHPGHFHDLGSALKWRANSL